jgi:hypothetical protein
MDASLRWHDENYETPRERLLAASERVITRGIQRAKARLKGDNVPLNNRKPAA